MYTNTKSIMSILINHWKLSPIVGEIINNKASVIFELYNKCSTVEYTIKNHKIIYKVDVELIGPTKTIIKFKKKGTYTINWYIDNKLKFEHEIIISNNVHKLIFVSCDLLEANSKHSLWDIMKSELLPKKRTAIMHLGDQAYMDPVFNHYKKIFNKMGDTAEINKECFEAYGQRYCDTWMPHARLLSNVSNYYIWDDHEITNDVVIDTITDDTIKLISNNAIQAYNLYQQSFHVNDTAIINNYCWYKYIDNKKSTIVLAIERTSREITLDEVFDTITKLNKSGKIKRLILCFTSAPIPYHNNYESVCGLNKILSKLWDPVKLQTLYAWLFNWMEEGDDREVVLVGGDIHFGVNGYITRNKLIIPILIASPITNQPFLDRMFASNNMCCTYNIKCDLPHDDIVFTKISAKGRRCYGVIDLDVVPMNVDIVYSEDKYPKNWCKYLKTIVKF